MVKIRSSMALIATLVLASTLGILPAQAGPLSEQLSPAQKQQLEAGKQVYSTTNVPGRPWPRIDLYQLVKATPVETAAIGIDFEGKPPYTPRLKSATIVARPTPNTFDVEYVMEIPIFGDEHITHRFVISTYAPQSYRLDWNMLKANRTKLSEGMMRVEPYGSETLVEFQGVVDPGIPFASHFKGIALDQTLSQSDGFVKEVEKLHIEQPAHLVDQIQVLKDALR